MQRWIWTFFAIVISSVATIYCTNVALENDATDTVLNAALDAAGVDQGVDQ
jgi:hypothetical protein